MDYQILLRQMATKYYLCNNKLPLAYFFDWMNFYLRLNRVLLPHISFCVLKKVSIHIR